MKTEVAIRHDEYPARIRDYAASKLDALVKFFDGTVSLRAVLERQREAHCVELRANVRRGVVLVVDTRGESISAALDESVDRMGRALRKHKEKLKQVGRRGARG